jgi:hypothetical protein
MLGAFAPDSLRFLGYYAKKGARGSGRRRRGRGSQSFLIQFKKVVLYKPIVNYELNGKTGMVGMHMKKIGTKIVTLAKAQVGVKTGKLQKSIHMAHYSTGRKQYIRVGSGVKYALAHHEGTGPHLIVPHPPRTHLRFRAKTGAIVYPTVVMHPGNKANRFLSSQLRKVL